MKIAKVKAMGLLLTVCMTVSTVNPGLAVAAAEQTSEVETEQEVLLEEEGSELERENRAESEDESESESESESEPPVLTKAETPTAQFDAATGILSNVDDQMQYSIDGGATWVDITAATVDLSQAELDPLKDIRVIRKGQEGVSEDSDIQILDLYKPATPAVPVVTAKTSTSITVTAVAGQEYSIKASADTVDGAWGTTTAYTGLKENTEYVISTRVPASGLILASDVATVTVKTDLTDLAVPTGLKAKTDTASSIDVSWNAVTGAESYTVYRSADNNTFTPIVTQKELTYKDQTGLVSGTNYYYRVCANRVLDGVTNSSALSASVKSRTRIAAPTLSILQKNKKNQLTWNEVPNVQVYRIFRATSKNGPYTAIATVSGTSYWDKNLDISKKYYYKVRGISQVGNKSYYGIYSSVKSTKKVLKPVVMLTETYGRKVYITWAKVKYSDGIVVYRADGASGGSYKKVATYEDGRTKFVSKKRKKGKTFRFKVRSFRIIDGKRVYGACSAVQKVTIK